MIIEMKHLDLNKNISYSQNNKNCFLDFFVLRNNENQFLRPSSTVGGRSGQVFKYNCSGQVHCPQYNPPKFKHRSQLKKIVIRWGRGAIISQKSLFGEKNSMVIYKNCFRPLYAFMYSIGLKTELGTWDILELKSAGKADYTMNQKRLNCC